MFLTNQVVFQAAKATSTPSAARTGKKSQNLT
jgi:hypothetical protein